MRKIIQIVLEGLLGDIAEIGLVSLCIIEKVQQIVSVSPAVLNCLKRVISPGIAFVIDSAESFVKIAGILPGDEIIFIRKMAVKGRRGQATVLGDFLNRNLADSSMKDSTRSSFVVFLFIMLTA